MKKRHEARISFKIRVRVSVCFVLRSSISPSTENRKSRERNFKRGGRRERKRKSAFLGLGSRQPGCSLKDLFFLLFFLIFIEGLCYGVAGLIWG